MSLAIIKLNKFSYVNNTKILRHLVFRNFSKKPVLNFCSPVFIKNSVGIQKVHKESVHHCLGNYSNYNCIKIKNAKSFMLTYFCRTYSTNNKRDNKLSSSSNNNDSHNDHSNKRSLPQLMPFPEVVWPSLIKSIKNWILITFIIRPYFDREFSIPDFVAGTKHALQVVSAKLAEGDLASLSSGLVAAETIAELKNVISKLSVAQRMELRINKDDIYLTFPYQVGIMFDESNEKIQKRWVEITMVFHVLRGLKEMQDRGHSPPLNMGVLPEYRDKISICNYRFMKEFTQGNESDWTINVINHFKPSDFLNE